MCGWREEEWEREREREIGNGEEREGMVCVWMERRGVGEGERGEIGKGEGREGMVCVWRKENGEMEEKGGKSVCVCGHGEGRQANIRRCRNNQWLCSI